MQENTAIMQQFGFMRLGRTYEYDGWGVGACSLEEVPDAGSSHALEHLHKLSSIGTVKRNSSFTCHGLGQIGLASSWRPFKHDALQVRGDSGHCWSDCVILQCMGMVLQCMGVECSLRPGGIRDCSYGIPHWRFGMWSCG